MGNACFEFAFFRQTTIFCSATINGYALFGSATFSKDVLFCSATFSDHAYFKSSRFWGQTIFNSAIFGDKTDFSSAEFKAKTTFDDVKFKTAVPEFHAATLFDNTTFTLPKNFLDKWPPLQGEGGMPAAEQKRAYNRLRLFMNQTLQIEEEQFFHRQEMRCKAVGEKWYYGWFYWVYEKASDYGNSVLQPAYLLFCLWMFGLISKLEKVAGEWWPDVWSLPKGMAWSFANLFPFFGFRRLYFPKQEDIHWLLLVIGGTQTVFGFILLFLLGLGLRNRFRLR